jgi:hypothetical protein
MRDGREDDRHYWKIAFPQRRVEEKPVVPMGRLTAIISIVIGNAGIYIRAGNGHIHGTSGQKNREKKCE